MGANVQTTFKLTIIYLLLYRIRNVKTHTQRNRKIVVDAVRETGETRAEREKNVEKKGLVQ